ncbi:MAG: AAA family ATPase [Ardenticatenaceae bacterium]|nr:AAA family ATPase [Ardenticatenaceae bacterium]
MGGMLIHTFGNLQIEVEGEAITHLLPVKGRALLVYLAVTGEVQTREMLASLLWSEGSDEAARTNLRVLLSKLRKQVGDFLVVTRQTAELAAGVWVDVSVLAAQGEGRTAVRLYKGDFLADFYLDDAPLFDEWVWVERERWRQKVLNWLHQLVHQAIDDPALTEQGIADARHILALDEWREEAHRQLMLLLARNNQRGAALAQYERCRQVLAAALGVEPAAATVALYEQIKADALPVAEAALVVPTAPRRVPHNLPAPGNPFVGREAELARLDGLLGDETCRLLTLIGPGGMGKTRLALQVAQVQLGAGRFGDGVFFVPLTAVTSTDHLISAIAQAVNFSFAGREPAETQLLNYLREKRLLLVLDNFEQLVAAAGWLAELLAAAAWVKLVVTSRVQLNLYEEWRFDVQSLTLPQADEGDWQAAGSVQLFYQRARRSRVDFDLDGEKTAVIRICHLVAGMPLGVELAAAWVRTLPCVEIAEEIARNLDFLATAVQDVPERHRSLRATFNYSWQLLSPVEQAVLQKLTVFRGGFTRAAAEAVADASLRSLSLLVDKSFVQREGNGRYQIHETLQQFAAEAMEAGEKTAVQQAHARYFAHRLHLTPNDSFNGSQMAAIQADWDNYRAAWQWLVTHKERALLNQMLEGFYRFYMTRGWHQEGFNQLGWAVTQWQDDPTAEGLVGRLLTRQGQCGQLVMADLTIATDCFKRGLAIARRLEDGAEIALALSGLGFMGLMQSRYGQAVARLQESIAICRVGGQQRDWAMRSIFWSSRCAARERLPSQSGVLGGAAGAAAD